MERFSKRHGLIQPAEITVRFEAPASLRYAVPAIAFDVPLAPRFVRQIVCRVLREAEDPNNWSDDNVRREVYGLLECCPWPRVYEVIEALQEHMTRHGLVDSRFLEEINDVFLEKGIGWRLDAEEGVVLRADETFDAAVRDTPAVLLEAGRPTAANEVRHAIQNISRRPDPDPTGAIQHAMAALECVARDILGQPSATLGALVKPLGLPPPLDEAVQKLWGFASQRGRHIAEGSAATLEEAEFVMTTACALSAYLCKVSPASGVP